MGGSDALNLLLGGVGGVVLSIGADAIRESRRERSRHDAKRLERIETAISDVGRDITEIKAKVAGIEGVVNGMLGRRLPGGPKDRD